MNIIGMVYINHTVLIQTLLNPELIQNNMKRSLFFNILLFIHNRILFYKY